MRNRRRCLDTAQYRLKEAGHHGRQVWASYEPESESTPGTVHETSISSMGGSSNSTLSTNIGSILDGITPCITCAHSTAKGPKVLSNHEVAEKRLLLVQLIAIYESIFSAKVAHFSSGTSSPFTALQ